MPNSHPFWAELSVLSGYLKMAPSASTFSGRERS